MQKTVFIYALNCPTTGRTRYIGKSVNPQKRFSEHLRDFKDQNHRANWIRALRASGFKPALEILDEVPFDHWPQWEVAYIEYFIESGFDLVNSTPGGEDPPSHAGKKLSPERCAALRAFHLGKKKSPEHRAKLSAWRTGRKSSPQTIAKLREIKFTPERLAACSGEKSCWFGKKHSPKTLDKLTAWQLGRKHTLNTSGFVGVNWHKANRKWTAFFSNKKDRVYVGIFSKIEDAVFARALAVDKYFS